LWAGVSVQNKICKVAWHVVIREKLRWIGFGVFQMEKQGNAFQVALENRRF